MTSGSPAAALAERYLRAVGAQDWGTVGACVAPDVVRLGPFGDDVAGRDPYLAYLQRTMPALRGYRLDIDGVTDAGGGRVFVELRETVDADGTALLTHECLVVDVVDGHVARVAIYIRQDHRAGADGGGVS